MPGELLEQHLGALTAEVLGELLREDRRAIVPLDEQDVGSASRLDLQEIERIEARDRRVGEQVPAGLDAAGPFPPTDLFHARRGRREDLHLARVVRAAHAGLPEHQVRDLELRGDDPRERRPDAHADQPDALDLTGARERKGGAADALRPRGDPLRLLIRSERLTGAVVVNAERGEPRLRQLVGEALDALVALDPFPAVRRADHVSDVVNRPRGSVITCEHGTLQRRGSHEKPVGHAPPLHPRGRLKHGCPPEENWN